MSGGFREARQEELRQDASEPPSSPLPPGLDMMRPTCRGGTSGSSGARGRTAAISSGTGNEALDSRGCRVRVPAAGWRW